MAIHFDMNQFIINTNPKKKRYPICESCQTLLSHHWVSILLFGFCEDFQAIKNREMGIFLLPKEVLRSMYVCVWWYRSALSFLVYELVRKSIYKTKINK